MSAPVKLSKTQQELLDAMRAGVKVHYMRYMGSFNPKSYYFRDDNSRRVTAAVKGLLEKGMIEKCNRTFGGDHDIQPKAQP